MEIRKEKKDSALSLAIEGRIDTTTAPQLETELKADLDGVTELRLDFGQVEYISSAGLRVLLSAQKLMNRQGKMVLTHVSESVMDVIDTKCACWLCYFAACAWGVDSYLVSMTSTVYTK